MICRVWLWNLAKFTLRNRALRVEVNMSSIKSEPSVVTGDERCCSNGFVTGCKQGLGIPSARASVQSDKRNVGALVGTDHFKAEKTKRPRPSPDQGTVFGFLFSVKGKTKVKGPCRVGPVLQTETGISKLPYRDTTPGSRDRLWEPRRTPRLQDADFVIIYIMITTG